MVAQSGPLRLKDFSDDLAGLYLIYFVYFPGKFKGN